MPQLRRHQRLFLISSHNGQFFSIGTQVQKLTHPLPHPAKGEGMRRIRPSYEMDSTVSRPAQQPAGEPQALSAKRAHALPVGGCGWFDAPVSPDRPAIVIPAGNSMKS
jgi:hypothetical protein